MNTLLATGTCFQHYGEYQLYRWLDHYAPRCVPWGVTQIGVSNDGPATIKADWIVDAQSPGFQEIKSPVTLYTRPVRLGRKDVWTYPGNWRNLATIMGMAQEFNFERVLYIEWDFQVYSKRMVDFIAGMKGGLQTFWCPRFEMAEAAFMCVGPDYYEQVKDVATLMQAVEWVTDKHQSMEFVLPWTDVHKDFVGERYPEFGEAIPENADFCAQFDFNTGISRMLGKDVSDLFSPAVEAWKIPNDESK
jgi:hypothetical protein